MPTDDLREAELRVFLEALHARHGYDFRNYSHASLLRRMERLAQQFAQGSVGELVKRILYEPELFPDLLSAFTVTTTEMFRDPEVFVALSQQVFPALATYPSFRIWHAGCGSGQEVYSLAILLHEAGLYERALIFATDINPQALKTARAGTFPVGQGRLYSENYLRAGGQRSFSEYYTAGHDALVMRQDLRRNVLFSEHNLLMDDVFSEVHLVLCRNVLIYLDLRAQEKALDLFTRSLGHRAFLCLGPKESIRNGVQARAYQELVPGLRLFQKVDSAL